MGLDVVSGEMNEVLTQVKLNLNDGQLNLEASFVKLTDKGTFPPSGVAVRKDPFPAPVFPKRKVEMDEVCSPLYQKGPSQPFNVPKNSEYVEFDATSLEKDAGQGVVPFFDLQPIHSYYPGRRPLTSVGILYKSKQGSGGFLSPVVSVYGKCKNSL